MDESQPRAIANLSAGEPGFLVRGTSPRGDCREAIYLDDTDRQIWLKLLGEVCERFDRHCHAYCQPAEQWHGRGVREDIQA